MSAQRWTPHEEDLLVENLELGYDLEIIASLMGRSPQSLAMKIVHLATKGKLLIMAPETFDAMLSWTSKTRD
jgi:hypothetical protein